MSGKRTLSDANNGFEFNQQHVDQKIGEVVYTLTGDPIQIVHLQPASFIYKKNSIISESKSEAVLDNNQDNTIEEETKSY
jgi:hypothetical protein